MLELPVMWCHARQHLACVCLGKTQLTPLRSRASDYHGESAAQKQLPCAAHRSMCHGSMEGMPCAAHFQLHCRHGCGIVRHSAASKNTC